MTALFLSFLVVTRNTVIFLSNRIFIVYPTAAAACGMVPGPVMPVTAATAPGPHQH
jgi:hypothetical protein